MRICIDSCVFIRGIHTNAKDFDQIIATIGPNCQLFIPRLITLEVTRNLRSTPQVKKFYQPFNHYPYASIIDDLVPREFVNKYIELGLREKGDAFIGGFAEWQKIDFLISDNRHFVRQLQTTAFKICGPDSFLQQIGQLRNHE